jgi:putative ABC transport system substrate-binding protein
VLTKQGRPVGEDQFKELKERADVLGLKLRREKVGTELEIKEAFEAFKDDENIAGIVVTADSLFNNRRQKVVAYANDTGLPTIYQWREFVDAGGLISYGPSIMEAYRMAGVYVTRILSGEKPWDMACSIASDFGLDLFMNPVAAEKLGIDVPRQLNGIDVQVATPKHK